MDKTKHRFVLLCLIAGVCGGVLYRGYSVLQFNLATSDRFHDRDAMRADRIASPIGTAYHFDPDASIVLGVGADQQPGKANWDDNANGEIDDPGELGAVGGDDVCLGPADKDYAATLADSRAIVISTGGFVEGKADTSDVSSETRYRSADEGWLVLD